MASTSEAHSHKPSSNLPPRKRRKRTVVTGAADDCFTCARQGSQCDRRRPFCSQCLDSGLECAGYKTTLTWGVGVASRGKLRGLSLPVTGSQPAASSPKPRRSTRPPNHDPSRSQPTNAPSSPAHLYSSLASSAIPPLPQPRTWTPIVPEPVSTFPHPPNVRTSSLFAEPPSSRPTDSNLSCAGPTPYIEKLSATPPDISAQIISLAYTGVVTGSETASTGMGDLPGSAQPLAQWPCNPPVLDDAELEGSLEGEEQSDSAPWMNSSYVPTFSQQLVARSVGRTPRLRYLISYYAEVIAPMIVAFDSPSNPFRTCILQLAQHSESLQEAIATLSTSNIRQRRERKMTSTERTIPARMSSLAHRALTDSASQYASSSPEELARFERYHRGKAVSALNVDLGDPNRRLSDSVLATLLILCLFHGCDTGIAQFQTQFAGVTKLLAIRMRSSAQMSDELKWFIRMFTWYDTMTATTNNREMQLRGVCLQISSSTDCDWGLENMAGCDPVLFKYLTQLGRLNALSQSQELSTPPLPELFVSSAAVPPTMAYSQPSDAGLGGFGAIDPFSVPAPPLSRPNPVDASALPPAFWAEWHSLRQKLVSWRLPPQTSSPMAAADTYFAAPPTPAYISPPISPPSPSVVSPQNMQDVYNISESFRHAALLYTERLANPDLPSSHPRIQHLVHRTMQHISAAQSDVYLLWPLFIAGSECVHQSHRTAIQQRCRDISKDSGFLNNLVCLELLEKIWAEDATPNPSPERYPRDAAPSASWNPSPGVYNAVNPFMLDDFLRAPSLPAVSSNATRHGLRWHEAMQARRGEGEYMVV